MKRKLLSLMLVLSMLSSLLFALPQVAEAEANDLNILDDGGVNISATISASSGYPASKMIDGDSGTYYQSSKGWYSADRTNLTITIALPSAQTISGIQIHEKIPNGTPCTTNPVTVKLGTSSSNAQTITTGYLKYPGAGNYEAATYFDFGGDYTGSYLEINFTHSYSKDSSLSQYEIYEIEAYRAADYGVIMYDGSPRAKVNGALSLMDESDESVTPKISRGVFMAPAAFLADSLGLSFTQSDSQAEFTYNGKSSVLTSADGVYSENGHVYVPAEEVCKDLGIRYESEACGLFFADAEKDINWNDQKELLTVGRHLRDVVYETAPKPDAVIAQLKANNPSNEHPRLFFSGDMTVAALRERINHPPYASWAKTIISNADRYVERMADDRDPIEYEISGDRLIDVCERVLEDVENIGFAYLMTGDTKYSDKVVEAVMTVCQFSDWNPYHFLDVGHMAAAVALGYDWCYDEFTQDQRTTVKNALINYALKPVMEDYNEVSSRSRSFKWSEKATDAYPNNWIAICTGGTIMAALAIGDEDLGSFTDAGAVVTEGMKRFKDLADTYLPDGGFLDGPQYWEFAMNFIGNCVGSMRSALGTDYGLSRSPGFNVTFDWQSQIEGSMGAFNFDSATDLFVNSPEFILFGKLTGKEYLVNHRVNHQLFYTNTAAPTFKDILWYDGGDYNNANLPLDYHSKGATNLSVLRSGTDASDTWVAMYAGYRKKANDAMQDFDGTFVFDMNGKRWALDYGAESQTYSSSDHNFTDYYICRPEGHNTVIISESADSGHDSKACGSLIKSLSNDRMAMAVYDLTDQLDDYGATIWTRGIKLDRGLNKITVQDELATSSSKPYYWFMHTEAEIEITDGGKGAILTLGDDKIKASLITDDASLAFSVRNAAPLSTSPNPSSQKDTSGTRKLTVHSNSVTSVNMAVEFVPYSDGDTVTTESFTPMSSWALKGNGVFVKDSYSTASGEGEYAAGATVTVNAGERADAQFAGWVAEGIDLADPSNPTQIFTMPSSSVWLTAKWIDTSFFDINFDNWTAHTDLTNADGTSSGSSWSANVTQAGPAVETDSLRTNKALKLTMNDSVSDYVKLTNNLGSINPQFPTDKVIWAEFSVKFEDGFTAVGYDHQQGVSPICISADGAVRRFDENARSPLHSAKGDKPDMYQLELGKWYHIVWAMDCSKAPQGDGGLLYVWVNGQKILNGTDYSSAFKTAQDNAAHFGFYRLYVEKPSDGTSTVYLDNLKGYATYELDNHAAEDFVISYPQDGYFEENGTLFIDGSKKVYEIAADFAPRSVVITRDGEPLASDAAVASGDIINITATNGIGFKCYNISTQKGNAPEEPDNPAVKINDYIDISFDNWQGATDGLATDGSKITMDWAACTWALSIAADSERGGKVLKANVAKESDGSPYFVKTRMRSGELPSKYTNCKVLWNEFSIKYEGGFAGFGFGENNGAYNLISINKDGKLELGARWGYGEVGGTQFERGVEVAGSQLEVGKWYDIAVAIDFANATDAGSPTYVFVNGDVLANGIINPNVKLGYDWGYHKLWFDTAQETPCTAYIDDLKVYETDILVLPEKINVMTHSLNSITANISTRDKTYHAITKMADGSKDENDMYKSLKTDAEKDGLKVVAALDGVYRISSVTVTERWMGDQGLKVTVEIGKNGKLTKVVDNQPVNQGEGGEPTETTYGFIAAEGDTIVYTFNAGIHRSEESDYQIWELEAMGTYVEDVDKTALIPEIGFWYHNSNDAINTYYINCNNAGDEDVSGKFFIAAYKDCELVKLIDKKAVTLKKGANTICCIETDGIYDPTWTYKAFIWDGSDDATPIVASVDIIK